jgi:glycosyltransferase involved in cell wall biosynthesis
MIRPEQIAVVIPCLNEAEAIASLVENVCRLIPTVLVVDDGSDDATAELAEKAGATVIRHEQRRGKGAALRSGWTWAWQHGFLWALTMDGDGQHSPGDIEKFMQIPPESPLVIGNRMGDASKMPFSRRQVNRWMSRQISKMARRELPDTQCGFRRIHLETWSKLGLDTGAAHFEIESELLVSFVAAGRAVEFVPVEVVYRNERSKIHPLRDTIRWFKWRREARRRLAGLPSTPGLKPVCEPAS